ncbi:MAG TPA: VacJ family lipoprotein [Steroidobacteraceae bacterium]|nr:VacJ family lipoprotein [Steroidobacteraceae bacterium]
MHRIILTAALALSAALTGCATLPNGKHAPGDPWERMNRSIWTFDNAFDHALLRPVARGYVRYTPPPVRHSINNFMTNLTYSDTIINDFLQGKFSDGGNDIARLVVNTVIGIGGLFDPASHMDLDRHNTDVGQTLGIWGVRRGPFLVLPFLGPSDVRDAFGEAADEYLTPRPYLNDIYARWSIFVVNKIDDRAGLLDQDRLIDSAYDSYAFVRGAYLQNREFKVHGNSPAEKPETPEDFSQP